MVNRQATMGRRVGVPGNRGVLRVIVRNNTSGAVAAIAKKWTHQ
jgi:hypothetical protein